MTAAALLEPTGIMIPLADHLLRGALAVPPEAAGVVIMPSTGADPGRDQAAAELLGQGFATVTVDLLAPGEPAELAAEGDPRLLAQRLRAAADWMDSDPAIVHLPVAYFAGGAGAAAALLAAAEEPWVRAVVAVGGRRGLEGDELRRVRAATLLIVPEGDAALRDLNTATLAALTCPKELRTVRTPGGDGVCACVEASAPFAAEWFTRWLPRRGMR